MKMVKTSSKPEQSIILSGSEQDFPVETSQHWTETGFTLLEALMALVVLMFGLVSIASLISYAVASDYQNKIDTVATQLAVQKMEQLRAQDVSSLADGGCALDSSGSIDYSQSAISGYSQTSAAINNVTFDIRWNITTSNGLRKIVVAARRSNGIRRYMNNVLRPVNVSCLKQS